MAGRAATALSAGTGTSRVPDEVTFTVLPGGGGEGSPVTRRYVPRACLHRRIELDDVARRVYCADCQAEVDAFDSLAMLSNEFDRWVHARDRVKREATQKQDELADLKRQVRNAKAALRRLRA